MSSMDELVRTAACASLKKRAVRNAGVLNEAYAYFKPSSFSRGMRIDLNGVVILLISGTASIDECGKSVHIGDLRAQLRRTFSNIAGLLESEGCTWHDIVRTTCYLRDIDRDYEAFNEERTAFYQELGLDPLPASTGIEAKLCRPELLVEIEAIAMFLKEGQTKRIRLKASLDGQPPSGRSERKLSLTDPKRKSRIRSSSVTHWLKACQTTERQKILHDR